MDDILGLKSKLVIDGGLGVSEELFKNKEFGTAAGGAVDYVNWMNAGINERTNAASWLVPAGVAALARLLPDARTQHRVAGVDGKQAVAQAEIVFAYQVEPEGQRPDRAHRRQLIEAYTVPAKNEGTLIQYVGSDSQALYLRTPAAVMSQGRAIAAKSNARLQTSIASAMHVAIEKTTAPECLGLFAIMWMIQLDVAAGALVELQPNINAMLQGVPVALGPQDQGEAMKALDGVRVHANSLDALAQNLLYAACDRDALVSASGWLDRYRWPATKMCLYGGTPNPALQRQTLNSRSDAAEVASAIVSIATRYGLEDQCKAGYSLALYLYGSRSVNSTVRLRCNEQRLFHEAAEDVRPRGLPQMTYGLSSAQLPCAAWFIGYANAELLRDLSRVACTNLLNVHDEQPLRRYLADVDMHVLSEIAVRYEKHQGILSYPPIDYFHTVQAGLVRVWRHKGIMHTLALGMPVANSITNSAIMPLDIPSEEEMNRTDILTGSALRAKAQATMWLANELIQSGGSNLYKTLAQAVPKDGSTVNMHQDIRLYMDQTLQLKLLGFGNPLSMVFYDTDRMFARPRPEDVVHQRTQEVRAPVIRDGADVEDELFKDRSKHVPETAEDLLASIKAVRGPRKSTIFQRKPQFGRLPQLQREQMLQLAPRETPVGRTVHVEAVSEAAVTAVRGLQEKDAGPLPTSGAGLLCGAEAMLQALQFVGDERYSSVEAVNEVIRSVIDPTVVRELEEVHRDASGEVLGERNYTADHLSLAAEKLGYGLVVIAGRESAAPTAYALGRTDAQPRQLVLFNMTGNHWEGPGTGGTSVRVKLSGAPAGTPGVSRHLR